MLGTLVREKIADAPSICDVGARARPGARSWGIGEEKHQVRG